MPGDLWTGYLQAQAADVAETEREEDKKRERLEEQLQKLNMEGLRRRIDRDAQKWEIEKEARTRTEGALSRLSDFLPPEFMDAARAGIDLSGLEDFTRERYDPTAEELKGKWRIGAGLQPKAGAGAGRSMTDAERANAYSKIPEDQRTPFQRKFLKKYFEGTRGGTGGDWGDPLLNEIFGGGGETSGATFDPASGAFIHVPEGMAGFSSLGQETGLENLNMETIGQPPAGTVTEEDEFIEEARGKKVNWDAVAKDHPDWNIFYIKQKLGVNE